MHQGFSDDSSGDVGEKTLLLCGCVARYQVWSDFSFAWEAALATEPSIKYFKMREARLRIKEFDGWRMAEAQAKIKLLANVVVEYSPRVISTHISRREFGEIVGPIIPYMMRHPYEVLFYTLIDKLAQWQYDCNVSGKTEWVFDEQGDVGTQTVVWYAYLKGLQPPHLAAKWGGTPIFRSDKEVLPLQAADLVAWHRRRRIEYPEEKVSSLATAVIEDLTYGDIPVPREYMTELAQAMAMVPGIKTVHGKPPRYAPGLQPEEIYGDEKKQ